MQHVVLENVDSTLVRFGRGCVVFAKVTVFHNGSQPRWPVGKLVDLDWLLDDDAVGSHPGTGPDGHIDYGPIPNVADIRLGVDGDRCLLPRVELPPGHGDRRSVRGNVIGERIWIVARVTFAPESVLHQVHPFDQRISLELGGQQGVQLSKRFLKLRMVVTRLAKLSIAFPRNTADIHHRYAISQEWRKRNLFRLK